MSSPKPTGKSTKIPPRGLGGASNKATPVLAAKASKIRESDRRRAEGLLDLIARRKDRIAEDFYEIGKALRELQQKKLYLALGHASFSEMLDERKTMSLSSAKKLIEVVSKVPLEQAIALGPEKAYALARYAAATPQLDTPASLLEIGAEIDGKKVAEASLRDLAQAAKKARAKTKPVRAANPEEAAAAQAGREVSAWLRAHRVRGARVDAKRGAKGYRITIDLPVTSSAALVSIRS